MAVNVFHRLALLIQNLMEHALDLCILFSLKDINIIEVGTNKTIIDIDSEILP